MVRKLVIGMTAVVAAAAGMVSGHARGDSVVAVRPTDPTGCMTEPAFARGGRAGLATGRGLWAVAGGTVVSATADRSVSARAEEDEMIRHVAAEPGVGTAYVVDRAGGDDVVVITPSGTRRISEGVEATHPAWSPSGELAWATGSGVAVLGRDSSRVSRIEGPVAGGTVFSPVFLSPTRLAVVVSAPPTPGAPEGGRHDDLWVTNLERDGWRRLTSFRVERRPMDDDPNADRRRREAVVRSRRRSRFVDGGAAVRALAIETRWDAASAGVARRALSGGGTARCPRLERAGSGTRTDPAERRRSNHRVRRGHGRSTRRGRSRSARWPRGERSATCRMA